jgi:hypothetical protein
VSDILGDVAVDRLGNVYVADTVMRASKNSAAMVNIF